MSKTSDAQKRTTVLLDPEDQETLDLLKTIYDMPHTRVIRRAIRLARLIQDHVDAGGEVVLENGDERKTVVFMP